MATGEKSGTWGNITNTNLELVGQALGYGTRAIANASTDNITIADGSSDADRSMYLKLTGGGQACTVTLLPNTSSKMWIMENATSYTLTFTQGSGANVAIPAGQTKMIFADGLGSGAVVYELGTLAVGGVQSNGTVTVGVDDTGHDVTFFGATAGKKLLWDESADALIVTGDGTFEGLDTSAISGIVESNANFIDMCLVGPSVDGMSWNGYFSNGAVWTSLMLATVETAGSDAQLNIWDLTGGTLASATPLATLTLSGATATSIAASMGYVVVGTSDQGAHHLDPHDGAWAERSVGFPYSLTASTNPALSNVNVGEVAAGIAEDAPFDPRTGGKLPAFAYALGAGSYRLNVWRPDDDQLSQIDNDVGPDAFNGVAFAGNGFLYTAYNGDQLRWAGPISQLAATMTVNPPYAFGFPDFGSTATPAKEVTVISAGPEKIATGSATGLSISETSNLYAAASTSSNPGLTDIEMAALITRAFNTGMFAQYPRLIGLAQTKTADRSAYANTLTESGTVPSAAVYSGAELLGYGVFSTSNYLSRANDADFAPTTGDMTVTGWFRCSASPAVQVLFRYGADGTNTNSWLIHVNANGTLRYMNRDSAGNNAEVDSQSIEDDVWHQFCGVTDRTSDVMTLYIDGVAVGSASTASLVSITNTTQLLEIGCQNTGGTPSEPAGSTKLTLLRMTRSATTASQVRTIFENEAPMFAENAKCLLQGDSDAVLDAQVDPLTNKILVTQSNKQNIWNGLAIESERTIATGGSTFEHGLLWGDAVVEINNANLYAATPATDQRQVNEMVRSMSAELPVGVDLSKAKAWAIFTMNGGLTVYGTYNIESLTDTATGRTTIKFAVPFKSAYYVTAGSTDAANIFAVNNTNMKRDSAEVYVIGHAGSVSDSNRISAVFFGDLENE
jgi:hypothetical protein